MKHEIQIGELTVTLDEAAETLRALRFGQLDAVVVAGPQGGDEVFTFRDPSHPYRLLVEAMNEGAALTTTDGLVTYHNSCFGALAGAGGELLRGRTLAELVAAGDQPRVAELLARAHSRSARAEVELATGTPVQLSVSSLSIGDLALFCVIATDLRGHLQQEELHRKARTEIEARDRRFSIAAHELRNPLATLEFQILLLRRALQSTPPALERALALTANIEKQKQQLTDLVGKLLDVGSIGGGRLSLSFEQVDLADVVRVSVERADELLHHSGSSVELELEPVYGRWDRVRLEQVVANLISNAAKYGPGAPIRVAVARRGSLALLSVEDGGKGIPLEARERIFRPYERIDRTSTPGLGLGLYITAEIVKAHGGEIRVEGEPSRGARFVVELPVEADR
ncbi:MAG TPA: ATP-binding protein [Polyangia bacterium]|nr:ATP-binding protein [Polyangia bacterium]